MKDFVPYLTGNCRDAQGHVQAGIDKKHGVNWPKSVHCTEIDDHFSGKAIGMTETIKQALDGVDFLFIVRRRRSTYDLTQMLVKVLSGKKTKPASLLDND